MRIARYRSAHWAALRGSWPRSRHMVLASQWLKVRAISSVSTGRGSQRTSRIRRHLTAALLNLPRELAPPALQDGPHGTVLLRCRLGTVHGLDQGRNQLLEALADQLGEVAAGFADGLDVADGAILTGKLEFGEQPLGPFVAGALPGE